MSSTEDIDATDKYSGQKSVPTVCERAGEHLKSDEAGNANGTQENLWIYLRALESA